MRIIDEGVTFSYHRFHYIYKYWAKSNFPISLNCRAIIYDTKILKHFLLFRLFFSHQSLIVTMFYVLCNARHDSWNPCVDPTRWYQPWLALCSVGTNFGVNSQQCIIEYLHFIIGIWLYRMLRWFIGKFIETNALSDFTTFQ